MFEREDRETKQDQKNSKKKQESQPANPSLYAHCMRAFTSGRLAWDRSEPGSKKYNPRTCAGLGRLLTPQHNTP